MTTPTSTPVLKEWAAIVHALLEGEQIVDLRKGGIREEQRETPAGARRSFGLPGTRCWLYATAEHQRAELLKAPYRHWIDLAPASPVGEPVTLLGWADVVEVATVAEPDAVASLAAKTIWTDEYATTRLRWKARDPLWALVLRAHVLVDPVVAPWRDDYGGCTSWVTLQGVPADPATLPSLPALSDEAFAARRRGVHDALPGGAFVDAAELVPADSSDPTDPTDPT